MTDLTAREVVEKLHQYDDLPSLPKVNIHFLATASGNEHLLEYTTEKRDNPIRFKGKRIGIIATHGVEETEVSWRFSGLEDLFTGRHFDRDVIVLRVRWHLRFKLSFRDLVEMMEERGLSMAHTTIMGWVQHYAPAFGPGDRYVGWLCRIAPCGA